MPRPEASIQELQAHWSTGQMPSSEQFTCLLNLTIHADPSIRESALAMLLAPPTSDELQYFEALFHHLARGAGKGRKLPAAIVEFLLDQLAFLGKPPDDHKWRDLFVRLLHKPSRAVLHSLWNAPLPVNPFLRMLAPKILPDAKFPGNVSYRRRRRLLRRRLLNPGSTPPWAQLTFRDLRCLGERQCRRRVHPGFKGRWLTMGRNLLLPAEEGCNCGEVPFRHVYWGGYGAARLRYMEGLLREQAEELRSIRTLARSVSRTTRRVVFSWHNATLAAAGGWAFEDLNTGFPSVSVWMQFQENVKRRMRLLETERQRDQAPLHQLWNLWEQRLMRPKLAHALWESRVRAALDSAWRERWECDLKLAQGYLDTTFIEEIIEGKRYGWPGSVNPHQRLSVGEVLAWGRRQRKSWNHGLIRLAALALEAQRLMDSGRLECLVLPWIDKFFISSRREGDQHYLPALLSWLEGQDVEPLVLFWEDTVHAQAPSLQLALKRLAGAGFSCQGIGIFDEKGSRRRDALDIITRHHRSATMFVLRPCRDLSNTRSFDRLLSDLDYHFFQTYDSSWKDGLAFLYAGTQVFPLLSVQSELETFPSWIVVRHSRYPFGAYFREALRRRTLGNLSHGMEDSFSREYAFWANLV